MEKQPKLNQNLPSAEVLMKSVHHLHSETSPLYKIAEYCKQHHLLFSSKRFLIVEKLCNENRFITAEALFLELKKDQCPISISCVYMNLKTLTKAKLLSAQTDKNGLTFYRVIP